MYIGSDTHAHVHTYACIHICPRTQTLLLLDTYIYTGHYIGTSPYIGPGPPTTVRVMCVFTFAHTLYAATCMYTTYSPTSICTTIYSHTSHQVIMHVPPPLSNACLEMPIAPLSFFTSYLGYCFLVLGGWEC